MDEYDDYYDPRPVCQYHNGDCSDPTFGECIFEVIPDLYEGHICPRSGLPALSEDD